MSDITLSQNQVQTQVQILSQRQIQSLELLSLSTIDLSEAVYKEVQSNPALEIVRDTVSSGVDVRKITRSFDLTRNSSSTSQQAQEASDNFQSALENKIDDRQSLQEHLLRQFHTSNLTETEEALGEKLIYNLDDKGFHIMSPDSLLDNTDSLQTRETLEKVMKIIQELDPAGTCTINSMESLYVQALQKPECPELAKFILRGHLEFINPPQSTKVIKKIQAWKRTQEKLFGQNERDLKAMEMLDRIDEEDIEESIEFIKTLDPFPARNFTSEQTHYISPDIYIERIADRESVSKLDGGLVETPSGMWAMRFADNVPVPVLDSSFSKLSENENLKADDKKMLSANIKKAQEFIENLEFRRSTMIKGINLIIQKQHKFFDKGPGNIVPYRRMDLAHELGVHESTVSRLANGKYIQCEWGIFELKYFFKSAVAGALKPSETLEAAESQSGDISKEQIMHCIQEIISEHENDKKKLSDSVIEKLLKEKNISISRRTVAKYRSQMNIESSYNR